MNRLFSTNQAATRATIMGFKKVNFVIFDMDGLLLDTESLYTIATQNILDPYGKTYTWDVKTTVMGMQGAEVAGMIVEAYDLPMTPEEYLARAREEQAKLMPHAALMPGAERLVRHLHSNNIPICLATSSGAESVEVKTSRHKDLFNLFHHKVMGSSDPDVKAGKPAPDIFLVAAKRFPENPDPANCLVFEDAPNGVKAARSAGMQVVMVPDPHVAEEERQGATQVLTSLEEFKCEEFGLPPLK